MARGLLLGQVIRLVRNWLFRSFYLFLFACAAYTLFQLYQYQANDRFSIHNIASNLPDDPRWEIPPLSEEELAPIFQMLDQPYTYLGKGSQCYVFESQDGNTVLKFIRHERYRVPAFSKFLIMPSFLQEIQEEQIALKQQKREKLFESCSIAYHLLKNETGLYFLQLNKQGAFHKKVSLIDKRGRHFTIDLADVEFLLQKKASLIYPTIETWMKNGELEKAQTALSALVHLLHKRYEMGIKDSDSVLRKNAGFIDTTPLFIDVGQFALKESVKDSTYYQKDIKTCTRRLHLWLEANYPTLAEYLDSEINHFFDKANCA